MTTKRFAAVALTPIMLVGALTGGIVAAENAYGAPPNSAYFLVNLNYCRPPATMLVEARSVPTGAAAIVYEDVLMGMHDGNCDTFYAKEVLPRLHLSEEQS